MITAPQLAKKVKELLEAQTEFDQKKGYAQRDKAKRLEREVADMVTAVLTAQRPKSGNLFETTKAK